MENILIDELGRKYTEKRVGKNIIREFIYPITVEQEKQSRITELEKLIERGQKVGDDISVYQQELKALYSGTHDEYIKTKEQEAIDAYTLELIEGGLL